MADILLKEEEGSPEEIQESYWGDEAHTTPEAVMPVPILGSAVGFHLGLASSALAAMRKEQLNSTSTMLAAMRKQQLDSVSSMLAAVRKDQLAVATIRSQMGLTSSVLASVRRQQLEPSLSLLASMKEKEFGLASSALAAMRKEQLNSTSTMLAAMRKQQLDSVSSMLAAVRKDQLAVATIRSQMGLTSSVLASVRRQQLEPSLSLLASQFDIPVSDQVSPYNKVALQSELLISKIGNSDNAINQGGLHLSIYTTNNFNGSVTSVQIGNGNSSAIQRRFDDEGDIICDLILLLHESRKLVLSLPDDFHDEANSRIDNAIKFAVRESFDGDCLKSCIKSIARILLVCPENQFLSFRLLSILNRL